MSPSFTYSSSLHLSAPKKAKSTTPSTSAPHIPNIPPVRQHWSIIILPTSAPISDEEP